MNKKYFTEEEKIAGAKVCAKRRNEKRKLNGRRKDILKKFNLTPEEYDKRLSEQNNSCEICGDHKSKFKQSFPVDHCHETGKIRGIICCNCNRLLGAAKDNIEILQKSIEYLIKYNNNKN